MIRLYQEHSQHLGTYITGKVSVYEELSRQDKEQIEKIIADSLHRLDRESDWYRAHMMSTSARDRGSRLPSVVLIYVENIKARPIGAMEVKADYRDAEEQIRLERDARKARDHWIPPVRFPEFSIDSKEKPNVKLLLTNLI